MIAEELIAIAVTVACVATPHQVAVDDVGEVAGGGPPLLEGIRSSPGKVCLDVEVLLEYLPVLPSTLVACVGSKTAMRPSKVFQSLVNFQSRVPAFQLIRLRP